MSVAIRPAQPRDLLRLESIENAADVLLIDFLTPSTWRPAPTAEERASMPGFVLVVSKTMDGDAVGFAQVLELDGVAHLEQLSVLPEHGRRGFGRSLVGAAKTEAAHRGYRELTLRTFAEVPWNAPFYASCGFTPTEPETPFHRRLAQTEIDVGLAELGRRIQMTALLDPNAN